VKSSFNPQRHHRRSIRLPGYDYTSPGAYFVTICVQNRECLLGQVIDGGMMVDPAGSVVQQTWNDLPRRFPSVELDAFVVMPNHVHGIIVLRGRDPAVGAQFIAPRSIAPRSIAPRSDVPAPDGGSTAPSRAMNQGPMNRGAMDLGAMNRAPTRRSQSGGGARDDSAMNRGTMARSLRRPSSGGGPALGDVVRAFKAASTISTRRLGLPSFAWQRNYYEHIIRSEAALDRIREYILRNPDHWAHDEENPDYLPGRR
jgi:REP element-mobilizing transposase RayT